MPRVQAGPRLRALLVLLVAVVAAAAFAPAAGAAARHAGRLYAVGQRSYTFVDRSRPTAANGSYAGTPTRTLPTLLLYPTAGGAGGQPVEGARPLRHPGGFPLVVFSHGFGASGPAYRPLLQRLAAEGYVVAAPTFPLSSGAAPGGPALRDYVNQPADVSFVIGRVLRLARADHSLRRTVDRHDVGIAGHSLGAITTLGLALNSCCHDRRVEAAVAFSGLLLPFGSGTPYAGPIPPLMLVHGDKDGTVPYSGSTSIYAQAPAPKALLTLLGAPHTPFVPPWLDPTVRSVTDFLDGYLKHDRRALRRLGRDGDVPGVATLQQDLRRRR
jgi:dienelactone hydrolase